jgi:CRP-like cAMP-binding protein
MRLLDTLDAPGEAGDPEELADDSAGVVGKPDLCMTSVLKRDFIERRCGLPTDTTAMSISLVCRLLDTAALAASSPRSVRRAAALPDRRTGSPTNPAHRNVIRALGRSAPPRGVINASAGYIDRMPRSRTRARNGSGNRLLDALPAPEFAAVERQLEPIELSPPDLIYERGQPIEFVHFPVAAVISLVTQMRDGRAVEIAIVGNEGLVGLPVFLQAAYTSTQMAIAQVPGPSLRMRAEAFTALLNDGGTLRELLQRYTQALVSQIAQSSACNRLHVIEQRCARWLLQTHDRVRSESFPLTQQFLAQMLGVQRTSVNAAAGALQNSGLIRYSRGVITVLDREGLEAAACECYRVITDEINRLVPSAH